MQTVFTYGVLPRYEDFSARFFEKCPDGIFRVRNFRGLDAVYPGGNVDLSEEDLWETLNQCADGWQDNHDLGDFASSALQTLGFEWV